LLSDRRPHAQPCCLGLQLPAMQLLHPLLHLLSTPQALL
jgi:hypothetical protein